MAQRIKSIEDGKRRRPGGHREHVAARARAFLDLYEKDFGKQEDLLSCPFCGCDAYFGHNSAMSYVVRCANLEECGAKGPIQVLPHRRQKKHGTTMKSLERYLVREAVKGWNRREE